MQLLVLSTELPPGPGGIGSHAHQLTRALVAAGFSAKVLGPQDYVSREEAARWRALQPFDVRRLRHLPGPPLQGAAWGLATAREIHGRQPHCLLASGARAVWLAAAVAPRLRVPYLAVAHGTELLFRRSWERRITRWAFERADAVVAVSRYTRGLLLDAAIRPRRLEVIPNGADGEFFTAAPEGPSPQPLATDSLEHLFPPIARAPVTPLLVTVGRLCRRKGQDLVVRALPRILETAADVHYVAAGLPEGAEDLRRLAADLGVGERVHLPGRLPAEEVRALLHAAAVFVMPSRRTEEGDVEGYGIAAVEAALCGLPSVVTQGSGLVEAIVPGETGLAVPPDDADALAAAVLELLSDEPRRRRMAEAARRRAVAEQTWAGRAKAYAALLRQLARGGGEGAA
ncbi:MAG: glycosyltransferase family 4 protein [Holophagales bacterium]|nr:glycosyltransferase family 4 protein [Holophagales bacterium]